MCSRIFHSLLLCLALFGLCGCDRSVLLGVEDEPESSSGGADSSGVGGMVDGGGGTVTGEGGMGASTAAGPVCGDGIPEGEEEQCDERGGTQTCTVECQFRNRVTDGLILLYTFEEAAGLQIFDRSGFGAPLNLSIPDSGATSWNPASLQIESPVLIESALSATKLTEAVQGTAEFTLEAWVVPATLDQGGPARIVTISDIEFRRNLTLGQEGAKIHGRVRTDSDEANGFPEFITGDIVEPRLMHLVFLHGGDGEEAIYVDGEITATRTLNVDFSSWNPDYHLALGAEFNEELDSRDFLGRMHLVAMYSRALSDAEVRQNFLDGP